MTGKVGQDVPIIIETSAMLLTFRCNLRCKLCCTATPQRAVEKQVDFPLDSLQAVIERYFQVVHYIRKLSFGGGEPTLYRFLPELIEYTAHFREQFEVLEIITNGAAVPTPRILDVAERYRDIIFFMIDDYGDKISVNAKKVSSILEKRGIRHSVRCYHGLNPHAGGWVDLGDYTHKHGQHKAKELLLSCCISGKRKNHTAITEGAFGSASDGLLIPYAANTNGLVHRCARAYSTLEAGAIQQDENFVDIMDQSMSVKEIREKIVRLFLADYYPACEYCNGFNETSVRYEPGEQLIV